MERRDVLLGGLAGGALLASGGLPRPALAQAAGDRIRKLAVATRPQSNSPQSYQAIEMIVQEWRKLGLDIEIRPMPRQQQSDVVWRRRNEWDMTMWQQIGRPERSDPDELVFNLASDSSSPTSLGYGFPGVDAPLPYKDAKQRLMAQFDDEYVQALMRRHGGNITQAAKAANLSRKHVYALLRRIELDGEDDGDPGADPSPPGSARGPR